MRHSRFTFVGAYHHITNRGDKGENIFGEEELKNKFIELVKEKSKTYKIKIFAYCIMSNHFHLIVQNSSGRISQMMRALDGQYAINYRVIKGGNGYVFQNRFNSTLIGDNDYLKMATVYVLLNPVKSGLARTPYAYKWSSINEYFTGKVSNIVDNKFIEGIFIDKGGFDDMLKEWSGKDNLSIKETKFGKVFANEVFIMESVKKFNRIKEYKESKRMRADEFDFEQPDVLIRKFEDDKGIKLDEIDYNSKMGKIIRYELLKILKEQGGLTYKEIIKYKPFNNLKFTSLGQMYKRWKKH